jgi:predicted alpha-1,2-mannosidase
MKRILLHLLAILFISNFTFSQNTDLTKYVDPFIGTGGHGHTYPGAVLPFGMMQLSPDTRLTGWDGCSGYHYSDTIIYGFSHTHLSGTGCSDYGDILLMPTTGTVSVNNNEYSSSFIHANEKAEPGYYSVLLDKYNIKAELTATKRAGIHRYTYPASSSAHIIIDLKHRDQVIDSYIEFVGDNQIRGYRISKEWANEQHIYFVAKFSKPFEKKGIYIDDKLSEDILMSSGKNIKAFVSFVTLKDEQIIVEVGISGVSMEGALKNLEAETIGLKFDNIKDKARQNWNYELSKITVETHSESDKKVFYTALYHSFLNPNIYNDSNGSYRGTDLKVHKDEGFNNYSVFSLWDTYRAVHPLFTLVQQKRTNDFINTFLAQYKYGGYLPMWELSGNETYCMIGYHAVPVIVDAYIKGIKGFDAEKALEAMKKSATQQKFGIDIYEKSGFVPSDFEHESVSKTLEYAYDDWCIAQMAKLLGKTDDYENYIKRAQYYKNVYDAGSGFMRAKYNGGWYKPFEPTEINQNYTEANAWQYTFYVPQDISGLIKLYGGKNKLEKKLEELFTTKSKLSGREQVDVTGLIGQYAHGNEPSHHIAYLFDYLGKPWKTQELINKICNEQYGTGADGLCGNEDCGQMSAWFVMSSLGFYQVCPGILQYAIGTPRFENAKINLENGKRFNIIATNLSKENFYIQSAQLNGQPYNKCYINHADIMNGGVLEFIMGNKPNISWGVGQNDFPVTEIKDNMIVTVPFIDDNTKSFNGKKNIKMISPDGSDIYYSTDGSVPNEKSTHYIKPFIIDSTATIKMIAIDKSSKKSFVVESKFYKIKGNRTIKYKSDYSNLYTAGGDGALLDHIRGIANFRLGSWQGFNEIDLDADIDLGKPEVIKKVGAGFLQDVKSWIWYPTEVEISVSDDGKSFKPIGIIKNTVPDNDYTVQIKDFLLETDVKARFVRIHAKNYGVIPPWHLGVGDKGWIFIDEIIVE